MIPKTYMPPKTAAIVTRLLLSGIKHGGVQIG